MASDSIEIVNMALARIQDLGLLASFDDGTPQAIVATAFYDLCLEEVLCAYDWGFARQEVALSARSDVTLEDGSFVYTMPSDCLLIRSIWSGVREGQIPGSRVPRDYLANPGAGKPFITTDVQDAVLQYTRKVTEVPQYPAHFVSALAWRLAMDFAMALTADAGPKFERAAQMYARSIDEAKVHDQRQFHDFEPQGELEQSRSGPRARVFPPWGF